MFEQDMGDVWHNDYAGNLYQKHYSGDLCHQTACYEQYSDHAHEYAGKVNDRLVLRGSKFPQTLDDHYFSNPRQSTLK